jgi:excisionase family DNA binding protein
MKPASEIRLLNQTELAGLLKISKRHLYRLLAERKLPEPLRIGCCARWRFETIERWIEAGCPKP